MPVCADEATKGHGLAGDFSDVMDKKMGNDKPDQGELLVVQGKWDEAYKVYSKQIAARPGKICVSARMQRMLCSSKLKHWQQVIDDGTVILNSKEGGVQVHSKVFERTGIAYAELKNYDRACSCFNQELKLFPDSRQAFVQLARCYKLAGHPKEAAAAQKKLDELDKDLQPF